MVTLETMEDIRSFIANEVMFTSEAATYLGITNQRLNQLVQSGKLLPVKVNRSGSLFLKKDLDDRKKDFNLAIADSSDKTEEVTNLKFGNSIKVIQEAINYYSIQALFKFSDKKTQPIFEELKKFVDVSEPIIKNITDVSRIIGVSLDELDQSYQTVSNGFDKLSPDDFIIKKGQDLYPSLLAKTNEAPPFLFMRGNIHLLEYPAVAVVGTRNPSEDGSNKAWNLARLLGKSRIVVSSGLAKGIDSYAHQGALNNKYPTIAVIGTPLTKVYPKENAKLQQQISEEGLIISQFPPSSNVQRWNFPMRNAVMSGISLATVVVEAGETSGALIQADYALKQNRFVFIPEGALNNPKLSWPKKYIQREGAASFSKIHELLDKLQQSKVIQSQDSLFDDDAIVGKPAGDHYVSGS